LFIFHPPFERLENARPVLLFPREIDADKGNFFSPLRRLARQRAARDRRGRHRATPRDGLASAALRPTSPAEYHRAWIVKRVRRNLSGWVGFSCQPFSLLALMVGVDGELLRLIVGDDR
jgi:hypothetical protein